MEYGPEHWLGLAERAARLIGIFPDSVVWDEAISASLLALTVASERGGQQSGRYQLLVARAGAVNGMRSWYGRNGQRRHLSIDWCAVADEGHEAELAGKLASHVADPETEAEVSEIVEVLGRTRAGRVTLARAAGWSPAELARAEGVTESRISQLCGVARSQLRRELRRAG